MHADMSHGCHSTAPPCSHKADLAKPKISASFARFPNNPEPQMQQMFTPGL
jgi:hypothetical protein